MKRLIILNGAPRTGKDTIASLIPEWHTASMKTHLIKMACAMSGMSRAEWDGRYEAIAYGHSKTGRMKDVPWGRLGGLSQREYLIWISEEVIKPMHGKEHFGWLLKGDLDCLSYGDDSTFILTDGGFEEEFVPFIGEDDWEVILIRLHREGCTFEGDSRNFLYDLCERELDVTNDGDIMDAVTTIKEFVNKEEK